jgi:hypothetical protein
MVRDFLKLGETCKLKADSKVACNARSFQLGTRLNRHGELNWRAKKGEEA